MEMMLALAAVPMSIARPLVKNWNRNGLGVQVIKRFLPKNKKQKKNTYRLYLPIKPTKQKIKIPEPILHALSSVGYSVDDYVTGIAVDSTGKRRMRIGKLLKDQQLLKEFMNDPQRAAHKDEFTCVISCHPYDVLTMSTGRRWDMTSCMRLDQPGKSRGGVNQHIVANDVAEGTLVAYAISPNDTNINKPHARLLIKPFVGPNGSILFRVETAVYGTPIPGFQATVSRWLRQVNKGAESGLYHLIEGLYDDGVGKVHAHVEWETAKDKTATLRSFVKGAYAQNQALYELLLTDKRWLDYWVAHIEEIYGSADEAAFEMSMFYGNVRGKGTTGKARITAKQFAALIDKHRDTVPILDLVEVLAPLEWRPELLKASKFLQEVVEESYSFDHFNNEPQPAAYVLNHAAYYDSRLLGLIEDKPEPAKAVSVMRGLMAGLYKLTPEWLNSTLPGAVELRERVGFLLGMLYQARDVNIRGDRELLIKLANKLKVDYYWTEDKQKFLDKLRWNRIFDRNTTMKAESMLCALDNSWPAQDPYLIVNADDFVLENQEVFKRLTDLGSTLMQSAMWTVLNSVLHRKSLSAATWRQQFPWTIKFIEAVAKGNAGERDEGQMKRAQYFVNDLKKNDDEMDEIMRQLGEDF